MPQLTRRARKDLEGLPPALSSKAQEIIRRLDDEPSLGHKLLGPMQGKRSARLGRSHRIIYSAAGGSVIVHTIAHRRDAYR
ncbi:MAG: type II toxin-antitoxin system RelE/ParE family toxin [bacterium]|nr:type II toxin-antitoxin system RelE/ParE family toxin [bacterium]MCY3953663.1 type II toxin-antitoxin system RelE/ParE family toxin [bacterium]MCY4103414.1 type II toxin-antitoxin system RelE/ParE family toxin [bacterium]